jgi:hypothetical protein
MAMRTTMYCNDLLKKATFHIGDCFIPFEIMVSEKQSLKSCKFSTQLGAFLRHYHINIKSYGQFEIMEYTMLGTS